MTPRRSTPVTLAPAPARKPRLKIEVATPGIPRAARIRAYVVGTVMSLGMAGVAYSAWGLQVGEGNRYRAMATRQHAASVAIPAPRGEILDARGRPLAVSADADSIWANPREIRDVTETAARVAKLVGGDPAMLEAKLGNARRFVWIARHVPPAVARAVREAKLSGIEVAREPRRWYPGRTIAGPVIGRADIDGNGLDGIELVLNEQLTGTSAAATAVRDARGRRMFADGLAQPEPGATVQLTIDRTIQAIADGAIAQAIATHSAKSGTAVVLEVGTGRVLALASYPTYDPNTGAGIADGARNRPVTDAFEAGSVMKVFTVAAAVDEGTIAPDTWFDLQWGAMRIGSKTIRDVYHDQSLTTTGIIKRSSNVGAVKVAQRLGREKLHAALGRFGFGTRTGIELPGEQPGLLRPGARWREIELATVAFGYGLTVTPLQMAAAMAALGDDGTYHPPRVIERITGGAGAVEPRPAPAARRAVRPETAAAMRAMLATIFESGKQSGTAGSLIVPGFKCGGKTGTAHKWDPVARQYAASRYLSSFAGLAPIDKPRLAIVVLVDEPSGGDYYGGKVAGPVFATIASESLRYLGVPGEPLECRPKPPGPQPNPFLDVLPPKTCIPAPPGAPPARGAQAPGAAQTQAQVQAQAQGPAPAPADAAAPAISDEAAAAEPAVTPGTLPDFRGMSVGRAIDAARAAGIALELAGTGRVVAQDPPPGSAATRATLRFSDGDLRPRDP
jgi:cell division protein FtsI (penicillin-binding protein 3)